MILPESEAGGAELLAKRIARAVAARPADDGTAVRLSVGVSDLRPGDHEADLVRRADDALGRAKGVVDADSSRAWSAEVNQVSHRRAASPGSGTSPAPSAWPLASGSTPKPRVKSIVLPSWPISSSAWSSMSRS